MRISLIAAYDENNVIGNNGELPWDLPEDLAWFKEVTMGSIVAMGRKTWESIGSKPLPGRTNLVLSNTLKEAGGATIMTSIMDAALYASLRQADLYFIGGEEVYKNVLPLVDKLYLTHVKGTHKGDSYFPKINLKSDWYRISRKRHDTHESNIYIKKLDRLSL